MWTMRGFLKLELCPFLFSFCVCVGGGEERNGERKGWMSFLEKFLQMVNFFFWIWIWSGWFVCGGFEGVGTCVNFLVAWIPSLFPPLAPPTPRHYVKRTTEHKYKNRFYTSLPAHLPQLRPQKSKKKQRRSRKGKKERNDLVSMIGVQGLKEEGKEEA